MTLPPGPAPPSAPQPKPWQVTLGRGLLALAVSAGVLTLLGLPWGLSPFYLEFATMLLVFGLFAMSLDLLVGYTGLVSLGHAAFFGIGAYTTAILLEAGVAHAGVLLPAAVLAAALVAAGIGALSIRTAGVSFIMITLALAQLVYYLALNSIWTGSTDGMLLFQRPVVTFFGFTVLDLESNAPFYYWCLFWVALGYLLLRRLVAAPFGRVLQGIRVNEPRLLALGFRTAQYKWRAFVIAGGIAGLAGHLFVSLQFFVDPSLLHWSASGQVLMMVVLGGVGTLTGPLLGAALFHGLEEIISSYTPHWMLPMGLVLVALVLFGKGGAVGLMGRVRGLIRKTRRSPDG